MITQKLIDDDIIGGAELLILLSVTFGPSLTETQKQLNRIELINSRCYATESPTDYLKTKQQTLKRLGENIKIQPTSFALRLTNSKIVLVHNSIAFDKEVTSIDMYRHCPSTWEVHTSSL